ncbi:MAG: DUF3488 and transglutaminase-like domain-containing protein [Methylophilaceae bacterium]
MNQPLSDTHIKWLLGTLALILALHTLNLPIWVVLVSAMFGVWRYLILRDFLKMPKLYVLVPITILIGVGILLTFSGQLGRDTSIAMLMAMLSLKLLEVKTKRDYFIVVILGYFATGNLFLFNQSISVFLVSIPPLILLTAALIQINFIQQQHPFGLLKLASKLLLQSVPLMLVFFVLFPRIPGPLWSLAQDAHGGLGVTGLSDSIKFNQVSQLAQDGSVAFRVQFKGNIPPKNQLYWRGPVLWITENNNWEASKVTNIPTEPLTTTGKPIDYSITLEANEQPWLLMLDMPTKTPDFASLTHDYSVIAKEPVTTRIRYDATSYVAYTLAASQLTPREHNMGLQLNEGENPRTLALGKQWQHLNPTDIMQKALNLFSQDNFFYTLNPPILGNNPIDDFLFESKRGFCEHYAVSFVTLMRAAGVPARVVTGYQGGELNPIDRYLIVRQSDAHAWAEVWLKNQGWIRIDPTAQVAPERIELGVADAIERAMQRFRPSTGQTKPEVSRLPFSARSKQFPLMHQLLLQWDSVNNGWNQWVIGYNQSKQQSFLSKLSGQKVTSQILLTWLIVTMSVFGLATLLFIYRKNQANLSPAQKLYALYLAKLRKFDLQPHLHEGAIDFAQRASLALPHLQGQLLEIAQAYNALQYSQQNILETNTLIRDLKTLIHKFKPNA